MELSNLFIGADGVLSLEHVAHGRMEVVGFTNWVFGHTYSLKPLNFNLD
jgi:hypothetical protein